MQKPKSEQSDDGKLEGPLGTASCHHLIVLFGFFVFLRKTLKIKKYKIFKKIKEIRKMKKRLIVVLAVLFLLFGSTTIAYSYWDNLQQSDTDITVSAGHGVSLNVSVNSALPAGVHLIPAAAQVVKANDVQQVNFSYDVNLSEALASDLTLTVTPQNVLIGGSSTYASLVNIVVTPASTAINSTTVVVSVTVTLSEPADQTAYDAVKDQNITFDLLFEAA